MEKELIAALVAMRNALKDVMNHTMVQETINGQTVTISSLPTGVQDYAAQCDLEAQELLLKAGVQPSEMPA
jgi:hypothetical protein